VSWISDAKDLECPSFFTSKTIQNPTISSVLTFKKITQNEVRSETAEMR